MDLVELRKRIRGKISTLTQSKHLRNQVTDEITFIVGQYVEDNFGVIAEGKIASIGYNDSKKEMFIIFRERPNYYECGYYDKKVKIILEEE